MRLAYRFDIEYSGIFPNSFVNHCLFEAWLMGMVLNIMYVVLFVRFHVLFGISCAIDRWRDSFY